MVATSQLAARTLALTYVLPLRAGREEPVDELTGYLRYLAMHVGEVLVVDGSEPDVVDWHRACLGPTVTVVNPEFHTRMGKVGNVVTGVRRARHEHVVIADDDVRYDLAQLARVDALLEHADVVRPQNYFVPQPWHARVDTARTLLNRVFGGDWPGTLAVRRSALLAVGGYDGDVMFENLELVRTVQAAGGRELLALDVLVVRRPPTSRHFRGQQVRQAYDEFARPGRLALSLAVLPVLVFAIATRRVRSVMAAAVGVAIAAECGRRRAGGRAVFPATSSLLAPPWLVWRSVCSWIALGARARGGVQYRGARLHRAATSRRELRRRFCAT